VQWQQRWQLHCQWQYISGSTLQARSAGISLTCSSLPTQPTPCPLLCAAAPDARCWALLLFYNVLLGLLLPLLLLVPLRQQSQPASGGDGGGSGSRNGGSRPRRRGLLGRLDRCIESCLRSLLWPPAADDRITLLFGWLARWLLLLTLLWMGCCLLAEPT